MKFLLALVLFVGFIFFIERNVCEYKHDLQKYQTLRDQCQDEHHLPRQLNAINNRGAYCNDFAEENSRIGECIK